ncbi:PREDICTED: peroxidase 44-like [Nicotiana attenuata]|uniref:peroxidase 44-like n=1 Tax=Nicotiana attenuata TaxID=49451 RepID=UPI0009049166|nr:PREDICTED: peroxidase 44-like [Nicotiana attenuata]
MVLLLAAILAGSCTQLKVGFYSSSCPKAESIVKSVVQEKFKNDQSITGALLRLHFHDCGVRGCDASILIDSDPTNNQTSEKDSNPNFTVRGYEVIDEIKEKLEANCPSTVSCADIITLATRDTVALAGGPKYTIPTGRRDGLVSNASEVDLPGPNRSVPEILAFFKTLGLNKNDMVTLLGAHTVGVAHCFFFQSRVSNFRGTRKPDPIMDPELVTKLFKLCNTSTPPTTLDDVPTTFLDQNTSFVVDNQFYKQILLKKGVLKIDQELALDKLSAPIVSKFATNGNAFRQSFAKAMVKMGSINVLVGDDGEIRKNCRVFNK